MIRHWWQSPLFSLIHPELAEQGVSFERSKWHLKQDNTKFAAFIALRQFTQN
jgi:hypothetical protein